MKRLLSIALAFAALAVTLTAQDKLLSVDDIFSPDPAVRVPFSGSLVRITWTADGRAFRQMQDGKLVRVNAETGEASVFYDADRFATVLQTATGMSAEEAKRTANSVSLQFDPRETAILLDHAGDLWHYSLFSAQIKRLIHEKVNWNFG